VLSRAPSVGACSLLRSRAGGLSPLAGRRNKAHGDALRAVGSRTPPEPPLPLSSAPEAGRRNCYTVARARSTLPPPRFGGWAPGEERTGLPVPIPRFAEPHRGLYSAAPYGAGPIAG